jgi:hypothetical protein
MEISWTDRVKNYEVLHRRRKERNILYTIKGRKAHWFGHISRRNYFLKYIIEGKIERRLKVTGGRGRGWK